MISSRIVQILLLVSSMMYQVIGMMPQEMSSMTPRMEKMGKGLENLPTDLKRKIISSALELKFNPEYEVYKKIYIGYGIRTIGVNENNTIILTGSSDGIADIWDVEKGELLRQLKLHGKDISSVALSADGMIALTGSRDKRATVFNPLTGSPLSIIPGAAPVSSVALSANGSRALIGYDDGSVLFCDTLSGQVLKELKGYTSTIFSMALSADGSIALAGGMGEATLSWNTSTGELISTLPSDFWVSSVALSADGTTAVTGSSSDKKALVWDVKTGTLLNTLLTGERLVKSVALSSDGKRALTGTNDGRIQVWNTIPLPGEKGASIPLRVLTGHTGPVTALAFGGADFIVSGSTDFTALIWKPVAS